MDDDDVDGDIGLTLLTGDVTSPTDAGYEALTDAQVADVPLTNVDTDVASVVFTTLDGQSDEGGDQATVHVALTSRPSGNVTLFINTTITTEGIDNINEFTGITFTRADWDTQRPVTITGVDDAVFDGDANYELAVTGITTADPNYAAVSALSLPTAALVNLDDEAPIGPGGIASGSRLWLKANAGVSETAGSVTTWVDQTGGEDFTQGAAALRPALEITDRINFNEVVRFDGSDLLEFAGNVLPNSGTNTATGSQSMFVVTRPNSMATVLNQEPIGDRVAPTFGSDGVYVHSDSSGFTVIAGAGLGAGTPVVNAAVRDTLTVTTFRDGQFANTGALTPSVSAPNVGRATIGGRDQATQSRLDGDMPRSSSTTATSPQPSSSKSRPTSPSSTASRCRTITSTEPEARSTRSPPTATTSSALAPMASRGSASAFHAR